MKEVYIVTPLEFDNVMFRKLGLSIDTPVKSTHIFSGDDWAHTLCNMAKDKMLIAIHTTLWEDLAAHQNREICLKSLVLVSDKPAEEFNERYTASQSMLNHFGFDPTPEQTLVHMCDILIEEDMGVKVGDNVTKGIAAPPGHVSGLAEDMAKHLGVQVDKLGDIHASDIKKRVMDRKLRKLEKGGRN